MKKSLIILQCLATAFVLRASPLFATTRTVTNLNDSGAGSLRQLISDSANNDTIDFAVSGVITLTSGELPIAKNLTITGPGANLLTVRRSPAGNTPEFRIFFIVNSAHVTISGLTIRNGRSYNSGGIYNNGATLSVSNCTFTANSGGGYGGGGIMNDGSSATATLKVNNCVFDGNSAGFMAGGILNFSTGGTANLTVSNCMFSNNSAFDGGAIVNYASGGTATSVVSNTTLTGNSASEQAGRAGAIHNNAVFVGGRAMLTVSNSTLNNNSTDYAGGGIYNSAGNLRVSNCTFSGNSANGNGGGIYTEYDRAAVRITNCTFSGNSAGSGGGIYCEGDTMVTIGNTIFKSGASGENIYNAAHFVSAGHNLSNDAAGGDNGTGPGGLLNQPGDIRNTDPRLSPVADNGGPTKTMALLSNSAAIDAGNDANAPPRDQRGYLRNGTSDIGAFEFGGIIPAALGNISTRAFVQTGDNVVIGGFIISGSEQKKVIVRAIGPSLVSYGITNPLQNPTLELHDHTGALIASNNDWMTASNKQEIIQSGLAPANNSESAILRSLAPGAYTAIVRGVNSGTGIALVEVYDLDSSAASTLGNLSTRAFVQTGDNVMIGGFIINGSEHKKVIVRAIGPSLVSYGITNPLQNPTLELHDHTGALIASNNDWMTASNKQEIINSGLAPANNFESAILRSLAPGAYTAIVRGVNSGTGIALVEVYDLN